MSGYVQVSYGLFANVTLGYPKAQQDDRIGSQHYDVNNT